MFVMLFVFVVDITGSLRYVDPMIHQSDVRTRLRLCPGTTAVAR